MDHILYWNQVALDANKRDFSNAPGTNSPSPEQGGPTLSSRALAIVHLAMYDAHAGAKGLPPYLPNLPTPPSPINAAAAVAAAAHACLSALYPRQKSHFDKAHQEAGLTGPGLAEGHTFGLTVAQAMLADRKDDPTASDDGYAASTYPGGHRKDPANPEQDFHAPFYGEKSKCFVVTKRHGLDTPPALGSADYVNALKQVRKKGIAPELMGTLPSNADKRTPDDTLIGLYWAYDGPNEIGTPPRLYNQILREIVADAKKTGSDEINNVDDNAKLFAMVNAAMGDAGILAWEQKYKHDLWRPVLGIREHDPSMGPAAPTPTHDIDNNCDPEWLPLGAPASNSTKSNFTPPFPAYPSGHATFGAAAFQIIRLWYGVSPDDKGKDAVWRGPFVSDELNGMTTDNKGVVRSRHVRKFPKGLWQMIEENGWSRIYLGVHWSFDAFALDPSGKEPDLSKNIGGVPLGLNIANDIYTSWKQGGNISCRAAKKRDATAPDIACDCVDKQ
uniref:vanadium-dependent haloperoxidase n=1 Tax=Candidatus Electronema sp. TaxID=2698783 RepID=UPI004055E771